MVKKALYEAVQRFSEDENYVDVKRHKVITSTCLWYSFRTLLLISIYFVPSICLTFYQRWLYQSFHFPLSVVTVHLFIKFFLAAIIRSILIYYQGRPRIVVNWKDYILAVLPTGMFSGTDISLSNWGLELVTVSLYTMTKSTTIVFILAFSILFKLEKKSWSLSIIVVMISLGLFLFTYEATQFNFLGFILLLIASISSGLRWTCTQLLLQKSKMGMKNPIDMIYHMQPCMIITVLPFAAGIEGVNLISKLEAFQSAGHSLLVYLIFKILLGALLAFFMEVTEVMVVTYTSSLTLSIAGIFKELFMLILAVVINGDNISFINAMGLLLCLGGIASHVIHKLQSTYIQGQNRIDTLDEDKFEVSESLINDSGDRLSISSDSENESNSTQVLFDILNQRDR